MITLIRNEFYKQKREWSFLFLLLLSLLPVLTGGAGAILARQKILCKRRQAVVKETGANQRISRAGHNPA